MNSDRQKADRPNADRHDQAEATGTQTKKNPFAEGQSQQPAEQGQKEKSAGRLAAGGPPAAEQAATQKSVGKLAVSPSPAAPQSRGERPE